MESVHSVDVLESGNCSLETVLLSAKLWVLGYQVLE